MFLCKGFKANRTEPVKSFTITGARNPAFKFHKDMYHSFGMCLTYFHQDISDATLKLYV